MFAAWGSWVARFRWPVLAVAIAAVIGAGVWGAGVFGQLSEAGYFDPGSESTRAAEVVLGQAPLRRVTGLVAAVALRRGADPPQLAVVVGPAQPRGRVPAQRGRGR